MDNSISNIITEIAQELDCGNDCYYNSKTKQIIAIPNYSQISDQEEFNEDFQSELKKVNEDDFIKIEILKSFESFKIMEQFVEQLTDRQFKSELKNILQNKKPFQNFKNKIDYSYFRESWFLFKQSEIEIIVKNKLEC